MFIQISLVFANASSSSPSTIGRVPPLDNGDRPNALAEMVWTFVMMVNYVWI